MKGAIFVLALAACHHAADRPALASVATPHVGGSFQIAAAAYEGALARDDHDLYWTDDAGVHRRPLGGPDAGASELVLSLAGEPSPTALAVHGGVIYLLGADGDVIAHPLAGGAPRTVVDADINRRELAVDDTGVYTATDAHVTRAPLSGGDEVELATASDPRIALFDGFLYWTDGSQLRRMPTAGGTAATLRDDVIQARGIAVDANGLVVVRELSPVVEYADAGPIWMRAAGAANHVVIDRAWIYAIDDDALTAYPRDRDDARVIARTEHVVFGLSLEDGRLYWVEAEQELGHVHVVMTNPSTGQRTEIARTGPWDLAIAAGAGSVFIADATTLYRISGGGAAIAPFAKAPHATVMPTYVFDGGDVYRDDHNHLLERRQGESTDVDLGAIGASDELFANAIAMVDGKVAVIHDDGQAPGIYLFDGKGKSTRIYRDDTGASWGSEMVGFGDALFFDMSWKQDPADDDSVWNDTIERLTLDGVLHPVWSLGSGVVLSRLVGNGRYLFALLARPGDTEQLVRIDPVSGEHTVILSGLIIPSDLAVDDQWLYVLDNNLIVRLATDAPAAPDSP